MGRHSLHRVDTCGEVLLKAVTHEGERQMQLLLHLEQRLHRILHLHSGLLSRSRSAHEHPTHVRVVRIVQGGEHRLHTTWGRGRHTRRRLHRRSRIRSIGFGGLELMSRRAPARPPRFVEGGAGAHVAAGSQIPA